VKRALLISAVLLCAWVAGATGYYRQLMMLPRAAAVVAAPTAIPAHWETFETNPGYDLAWNTSSAASFNPDYAPALMGNYSGLASNATITLRLTVTNLLAKEAWVYWKMSVKSNSASVGVVGFYDSGGNYLARLLIVSPGSAMRLAVNGQSSQAAGSSYATNTLYHVLLHYTVGTNNDSIGELWVNTSGVFTGSYDRQITGGTFETDIATLRVANTAGLASYVIDDIRIGATKDSVSP